MLGGRTVIQSEAVIRGDLVRTSAASSSAAAAKQSSQPQQQQQQQQQLAVAIGKYSLLAPQSVLHPPRKLHRGVFSHHPLRLSDNVHVGPGAVVEAGSVGNNVWIGAGAVVGKLAILREGGRVLEGAVVPPGMVVGAGEVVAGRPARRVGDVGWSEGWEGR